MALFLISMLSSLYSCSTSPFLFFGVSLHYRHKQRHRAFPRHFINLTIFSFTPSSLPSSFLPSPLWRSSVCFFFRRVVLIVDVLAFPSVVSRSTSVLAFLLKSLVFCSGLFFPGPFLFHWQISVIQQNFHNDKMHPRLQQNCVTNH